MTETYDDSADVSCDELRSKYLEMVTGLLALNEKIDRKLRLLEERHQQYDAVLAKLVENKAAAEQRVELNVGGRVFCANKDTLLRWEGTYFHGLLCGDFWNPDTDGTFFIDRDPDMFDHIIWSFRTGRPLEPGGLSSSQTEKLKEEVEYYQLPSKLVEGLIPVEWDEAFCSTKLVITNEGHTVTKRERNSTVWGGSVRAKTPDQSSFKVRVKNPDRGIMIGYVRGSEFSPDHANYPHSGWFLSQEGCLFSDGYSHAPFTRRLQPDDLITVRLNKTLATISFDINREAMGPAFHNITCDDALYPCIEFCQYGGSASLED